MRVSTVRVGIWRNLADVAIEIPREARFVCLVGENGTGKSSLLELIVWAAHHLGLSPGIPLRRPAPGPQAGVPLDVEVTLETERLELRGALRPSIGDVADQWDGTLLFQARAWAGDVAPEIPPGAGPNVQPGVGGFYTHIAAGGIPVDQAAFAGQQIAAALRALPELLLLYIDAERVFPVVEVRDEEVLALARQDVTLPDWLKSQAAQATQNLYSEWMRSMLGAQQRRQAEYFNHALTAQAEGRAIDPPNDPLASFRAGLRAVLPHLNFLRLDHEKRRLIFDSAGTELPYEELSGGERELAFLVGQLDRFGVRDGLFLLDEPELHLNPELLRGWLDFLRSTVGGGQAFIATHSLEAAEVAGPGGTFVFERGDDRIVHKIAPLADRPALTTLAAAVGTPAFSIARSRFVLVEGTRELRERERYASIINTTVADRFIEVGGCEEVKAKMRALRELAWEEEQVRVGGIVDRDFRTQEEREELLSGAGIYALPVHEIENFFLQPELVRRLLDDVGRAEIAVLPALQSATDPDAGRWAFEKAKSEEGWAEDARAPLTVAAGLAWHDADGRFDEAARSIAEAFVGIPAAEQARRRIAVRRRLEQWGSVRQDEDLLARQAFGKEALRRLAVELQFRHESAIEARAAVLWAKGEVERPTAANELREYLDSIPVEGAG